MRTTAGLIALAFVLGGCVESAKLDISQGIGPDPQLPAPVEIARDGSLLVADDVGNKIWRVSLAAPAR